MSPFILVNSASIYPQAGFLLEADHFGVMCDGQEVGTIYRVGDDWIWSINLSMIGIATGRARSKAEAKTAFRKEWDQKAARLGAAHVTRAMAIAQGKASASN